MAPEHVERRESTTKSDQWSFSATLYEALAGVQPFVVVLLRRDLSIAFRGAGGDHVQHEIGLRDLFERRAKCRDQRVREPIDEANRVGEKQFTPIGQLHLPDERIECHEQGV